MIKKNAVLASACEDVQREPNSPKKGLAVLQARELSRRQEFMVDEFIQRCASKVSLGDPANHLNVT